MASTKKSGKAKDIPQSSYVIVTPVKDEEAHIGDMIKSVLVQTKLPDRWIIVDDGSTDKTHQIIASLVDGKEWITVLNTKSTQRNLGSAEVVAFYKGLDTVSIEDFDFIVKLDGDVKLEAEYFHELLTRMENDKNLGIASGVYRELHNDNWITIKMPDYHAAGASKVVRRDCFKAIEGFVAKKGWDTLDEIRAGVKGWKSGHFADLVFTHLKSEGIAMGKLSTNYFHGEIYYQTGGGIFFLFAKSIHRMFLGRPFFIGGLMMIAGYLMPLVKQKERLVNNIEASFYRKQLNKRLIKNFSKVFSIY